MDALHRLATYGTLAPGRVNHHHVADLAGSWTVGTVRGRLVQEGWGAALGAPALVLADPGAPGLPDLPDLEDVPVHVLSTPDLPAHWDRLDAFEGPGYRRTTVTVTTADGPVEAQLYVLAAPSGG